MIKPILKTRIVDHLKEKLSEGEILLFEVIVALEGEEAATSRAAFNAAAHAVERADAADPWEWQCDLLKNILDEVRIILVGGEPDDEGELPRLAARRMSELAEARPRQAPLSPPVESTAICPATFKANPSCIPTAEPKPGSKGKGAWPEYVTAQQAQLALRSFATLKDVEYPRKDLVIAAAAAIDKKHVARFEKDFEQEIAAARAAQRKGRLTDYIAECFTAFTGRAEATA